MDPFAFDQDRHTSADPQQLNVPPDDPKRTEKPNSDSAIRTMKSDMDELFAKGKPTVAKMAGRAAEGTLAVRTQARRASVYLVLGLLLLIFFFVGGAAYLLRDYWIEFALGPEQDAAQQTEPPPPFFPTESTRTISVRQDNRSQFLLLMEDALLEVEREQTMKRLIVKVQDGTTERFANLEDVLALYRIEPPGLLLDRLDKPLMIAIFYGTDGSRIGFAAGVSDPDRAFRDLLFWEQTMTDDLRPMFGNQVMTPQTQEFEDRTYRNIDWRFMKLSREKDLGIGYTIFPAGQVFILTTSKAMIERIIDRMFDIR